MTTNLAPKDSRLPPRWFVRAAWVVHRAIYRLTRGRFGLWPAAGKKWGTFLLTTVGRRSGKERQAILGYYEDGANLVTMAMNGWAAPEPAWWLNLQAHPDATVEMADGTRAVRGRAAEGEELDRLWAMFRVSDDNMDGYLKRRPNGTAIVVLGAAHGLTRSAAATSRQWQVSYPRRDQTGEVRDGAAPNLRHPNRRDECRL